MSSPRLRGVVAAGGYHGLTIRRHRSAPEMTSVPLSSAPAYAAREERSVGTRSTWKPASRLRGSFTSDTTPARTRAAVDDPDDPAGGDGATVLEERPHDPHQRVALQQAVGVDARRTAACGKTRCQR